MEDINGESAVGENGEARGNDGQFGSEMNGRADGEELEEVDVTWGRKSRGLKPQLKRGEEDTKSRSAGCIGKRYKHVVSVRVPAEGLEKEHPREGFNVPREPVKLGDDRLVDGGGSEHSVLAPNFLVQRRKPRGEEWIDIEGPVAPTR
jgi:hypothetical protein